jgi:molybdate transport system ATP-binding protein
MSLEAEVRGIQGAFELDVQFSVGDGELVAVLGPNGAGKTTLLRALSGLIPIEGRVVLDGRVLDDSTRAIHVPAESRPLGVVFQDNLLFPHLTALENVAFGLRCRGVASAQAATQARTWLDQVGLADQANQRPAQLSGGQAQRVALARALATHPRLLLLDEPMAALDISARGEVRRDLRRQLAGFEGTRLLVTHDPLEAAALCDRLLVMEGGRIVQSGPVSEVTERPRTQYVADLAGLNLLRGNAGGNHVRLEGGETLTIAEEASGEIFAVIHPRAVALYRRRPEGTPRNVWPGVAESLEYIKDRVRVRVTGPLPIVAEVTRGSVVDLRLADGGPVWVSVKATEISVYPA